MFELSITIATIALAPIVFALIAMLLDLITGFAGAVKRHDVDSTKMRDGLWHKLGFVAAIVVGIVMEECLANVDFGAGVQVQVPTTAVICAFIILTELVSIAENLASISPELASIFGKVLEIKKEEDKDES